MPPYGYAFVILVGIFMIFLLVWSTRTNRIYVSQNSGTVQASNKTYIMSSYSGTLTELYISEGSYVNEGDLVAHIKSTDIDMQQDNLESQLKIYQTQVWTSTISCCSASRTTRTTSVRRNPEDQPYYYQYETYKSQVEQKTFDPSAYQAAGYTDAQIKTMMEQNQSEIQASVLLHHAVHLPEHHQRPEQRGQRAGADRRLEHRCQRLLHLCSHLRCDPHGYPPYKEGMVLSAGSPLATVASENDDVEVVAMVTVNDRPLLHVGDPLQDCHYRPFGVFLWHPDRHCNGH